MRRKKDLFVSSNSMSGIQELVYIAQDKKEFLDYRKSMYKRKIDEIKRGIIRVREEFFSFLSRNNIDPDYPVFNTVTGEMVVPDSIPEQSVEAVSITTASLSNIPNDVFLKVTIILRKKYPSLQSEIENYTNELMKLRSNKSKFEAKIEEIDRAQQEYQENVNRQESYYKVIIKNLEKINSLYKNLLDFKYLFTVLPDKFTSETYSKFQTNYLDRYSVFYHGKKTRIRKISEKIQESYEPTTVDIVQSGIFLTVFREIQDYFSPSDGENLPDKYVDAVPQKDEIISYLDKFSNDLKELISNCKITLDMIRGVKGIGNSVVDGLITSAKEISESFAAAKKVDQENLEDIINDNSSVGSQINRNIEVFKSNLQNGVDNLDERFIRYQKNLLRRMASATGWPVFFNYARETNLESYLREKIRQRYGGNIPFCDEIEIVDSNGDIIYVKKSDIDEESGKTVVDAEAEKLKRITRTDRDVTS